MHKLVLMSFLSFAGLQAPDISGNWQGTLGEGSDDKLRLLVRISKVHNAWAATLINVDQGSDWGAAQPLTPITLQDAILKFKVDAPDQGDFGAFEGTVNPTGDSIQGSWIQGGYRQPITFHRATKAAWKDPSAHTIRFVTVDAGVKLEVLDWGGSGRPVLLLAGNGNTAHVFDALAGKLAATYHVYGLTRRGFGASSKPPSGYDADRLGDDVLRAMDLLRLKKPVLIGHSIAGGELSSIGSRHADKVAGLVYLDSGYYYAYYDSTVDDDPGPPPPGALPPRQLAVWEGRQKYTRIQGPVLAIYAFGDKPDLALAEAQATAFEKGVPGARVLRFPKAPHYLFLSDEAAVLSEIRAFIATLP